MKLSPSVCCSPCSACAPVRDTTRWRRSCRRPLRREEAQRQFDRGGTSPCATSASSFVRLARARDRASGARLPRKEDDRLMRGRGQFVATFALPDCRTSLSSAARWRMRASAASMSPERYRGSVFTAVGSRRRQSDPRGLGLAGLQGLRAAGARHRTRCVRSANSSPCAWRRRAPKPRISRRR